MKRFQFRLAVSAGIAALLCAVSTASAASAPSLGSAQSFAVLGGSAVTNTGSSIVTGDLGVSPGTAVTGFPPGLVVSGTIHSADAVAGQAQNDVTTAYNALTSQACTADLTGQDLGGLTLTAGVYCFDSSAQLTGTLTLNAQGNAGAVFIFKIGSTLTTASGSSVSVINGGSPCNVFWQVGSSATLGTTTAFTGQILALTSITLNTGATVDGRALARNGAVTLASNEVTASCASPSVCGTIILSPSTLPDATVGVAYSKTITGAAGTAPYTFAVHSGTLPAGLTLTSAGVLAGTPTTQGTSNFTIRGTDANDCFADISLSIVVLAATPPPPGCPPITLAPPTLPGGQVAVAYNQTISGSGGTAPYSFGVTAGTLPTGLTLTAAGLLSGTPTAAGTPNFTVRGTDANGCFAEVPYSIAVAAAPIVPAECPPITLLPAKLPNGLENVAYSQTLTASGGTGPYTFGVTAGTLPPGLTLSSGGVLSGTPTQARRNPTHAGTSSFTIRATDSNGCYAEVSYAVFVPFPVPTLPQAFAVLLALGLAWVGFSRLRRRGQVA